MFERFTDDARRVVVLAQDEARSLGHDWIGTEHLLLALVRSDLRAFAGVDVEAVRGTVVQLVGSGEARPAGQIPFTPAAKSALEFALREALTLGGTHIGVEHLVLGVLSRRDGTSARVIRDLGLDVPTIVSRLDVGANPARFEPVARARVEVRWEPRPIAARSGPGSQPNPLERFTERARKVIVRAEEEARTLGQPAIGPEHLLLGVLRVEESAAARALATLGFTLDGVRESVRAATGTENASPETLPFGRRAKSVLERALLEALALGHNYIGAEHLLLGLSREEGGVTGRILADVGADADAIVAAVLAALSGGRSRERMRLTSPPFSTEAIEELAATEDVILRAATEAMQRAWERRRRT